MIFIDKLCEHLSQFKTTLRLLSSLSLTLLLYSRLQHAISFIVMRQKTDRTLNS